ncbi:MAG: dihydroorotase [Saprospiraceae bacterium]|nr:dihydroorotase [Saprospiraceae bacterium]
MSKLLIKNALLVNEGSIFESDILIKNDRIDRIDRNISSSNADILDAGGKHLIPGCIDDQVHFREPGLTHKATIATESAAAAAGGVTSFMEMPNTIPNALTGALLEDKYQIAAKSSFVNYSFYMGVSNENLEAVLKVNYDEVCGIKVFMGSSTGNMLVDRLQVLESLFKEAPVLIATHCEDEKTIHHNLDLAFAKYGDDIPVTEHPNIRSREACYLSSSLAVALAKKHDTRLHILHISTKEELDLFDNSIPLNEKRITAEACVHHLYFNDQYYTSLGNQIKCNPAIKTIEDSIAIATGLIENKLDVIATDHAPHTWLEKSEKYSKAPAGLPLVQHPLSLMITMAERFHWDLPFIVQRMAHNPAICFKIKDRGYLREGYFADLVLVDVNQTYKVEKKDLLYKCNWSPLEGIELKGQVMSTFVNGEKVFDGKQVMQMNAARRLGFDRG